MRSSNFLLWALAVILGVQLWFLTQSRGPTMDGPAEVRRYAVGEHLADMEVVEQRTGDRVSLTDLFNAPCTLLLLFHADCPYCDLAAPPWRGRESVGHDAPVVWISLPDERRDAVDFVRRYGLTGPMYMLPDMRSTYELGVYGTPLAMFASHDARFMGYTHIHPDSVTPLPPECVAE